MAGAGGCGRILGVPKDQDLLNAYAAQLAARVLQLRLSEDLRKAQVFKKYGLDFCCGGKKTVKEACAEKGLDVTKVEQELQQADKMPSSRPIPYGDWSLDFLADYIVNTHHNYVRKYSPELNAYAIKVAQVHGPQHPELLEIEKLVKEINDELTEHMEQEEKVLFTRVKKIVLAKNMNQPLLEEGKDLVSLVEDLEKEHDFVGRCLDATRALSKGYAIPEDACASYQLLYKMIQEFEDDLFIHIHLENNILFPKAVEMEKSLTA